MTYLNLSKKWLYLNKILLCSLEQKRISVCYTAELIFAQPHPQGLPGFQYGWSHYNTSFNIQVNQLSNGSLLY